MHAHTWTKCKRATPLHAESADKENYIESREIDLACSLVHRGSNHFHSSFFTVAIYQKVCIRDREKKTSESGCTPKAQSAVT